MTTFSMAQVERLTGISAHSLRIWERRYTFLSPKRTAANIRYYSDEEVKQLLNVGILIRNGYRISAIDKMKPKELSSIVNQILSASSSPFADRINGLILSMLELNELSFNDIYRRAVSDIGFLDTLTKLIYPFLTIVGGMWTTNKVNPGHEHFISNLIRQKIIHAIENLPMPQTQAKRIILFLMEGQTHEIPLLISSYIAKSAGLSVYYLGQNTPTETTIALSKTVEPDFLMTIFIGGQNKAFDQKLARLLSNIKVPLLYAGNHINMKETLPDANTIYLENPTMLKDYLESNGQIATSH